VASWYGVQIPNQSQDPTCEHVGGSFVENKGTKGLV
jgi:hypothetical protein